MNECKICVKGFDYHKHKDSGHGLGVESSFSRSSKSTTSWINLTLRGGGFLVLSTTVLAVSDHLLWEHGFCSRGSFVSSVL